MALSALALAVCSLCPVRGGALKPTDDGRWCHIVCAIWIPEPCITDLNRMQPIERLDRISGKRRRLQCAVCNNDDDGASAGTTPAR